MTVPTTTVLVAYIPTEQGRAALTAAIAEARLRSARLVVVNVSRGDAYVDPRFAQEADVQELVGRLQAAGVDHEWRQTVGEDPVHAVLTAVRDMNADLLVIGMRRRSPTGKLFLGSVSQDLLLHADCPVLAVKSG